MGGRKPESPELQGGSMMIERPSVAQIVQSGGGKVLRDTESQNISWPTGETYTGARKSLCGRKVAKERNKAVQSLPLHSICGLNLFGGGGASATRSSLGQIML